MRTRCPTRRSRIPPASKAGASRAAPPRRQGPRCRSGCQRRTCARSPARTQNLSDAHWIGEEQRRSCADPRRCRGRAPCRRPVDVRRTDGSSSAATSTHLRRRVPRGRARPERGPQPSLAGASRSVVPLPSASRTKAPRWAPGRRQRGGQLVGPQRGQVGGDRADTEPGGTADDGRHRGQRGVESGVRVVADHLGAERREPLEPPSGSSVTTSTASTTGQDRAATAVSSAKARARSPRRRRERRRRAGSWLREPLDRHDQAPTVSQR